MKLRNKKTGEVATLTLSTNGEDMIIMGNDMLAHITKLSELKDYEDYEDLKDFWYVDADGEVRESIFLTRQDKSNLRNFGNYFETKEEAEEAVEKFKAWKRLKDKGFKFEKWNNTSAGPYRPVWFYFEKDTALENIKSDLNLLFGGEE